MRGSRSRTARVRDAVRSSGRRGRRGAQLPNAGAGHPPRLRSLRPHAVEPPGGGQSRGGRRRSRGVRAGRHGARVGHVSNRRRRPPHVLDRAVAATLGRPGVPHAAAPQRRRRALCRRDVRAGASGPCAACRRGGGDGGRGGRAAARRTRLPDHGSSPQAAAGDPSARARARRGPPGGSVRWLRHGERTRPRRAGGRMRAGRAGRAPGVPRLAAAVRPAGRRVHAGSVADRPRASPCPSAGRNVMRRRLAEQDGHRATTATAEAIYPFVAEGGLGGRGVYIGRDLYGGSFCFDAFELYRQYVLTNPNLLVIGAVGSAKSSLVKTYLFRQAVFGRIPWVTDPKGEYGPLARALGVEPIRVVPGGRVTLNPLAPHGGWEAQLSLLLAVGAAALGRDLVPEEQDALREALTSLNDASADEPTLPAVVELVLRPTPIMAERLATTPRELARAARPAALGLQRLCEGE